ncbi:MAG TPA: 2-C-methyl-D-erythritol 4-phosphate cytidylyltransferase [Marmoricola sp.]|nr:2-C-methyl-D-erythritol 4-phosphate cytidylyltransferase [Marmoricola sp.]
MPFALIHGESLALTATWALEAAAVDPLRPGVSVAWLVQQGVTLVLHDPLCPLTPPEFISECVSEAESTNQILVGVRPVTDTIKVIHDDLVGATLDREKLWALASPIVIPLGQLAQLPEVDLESVRFQDLLPLLPQVRFRTAPVLATRVHSEVEVQLLEAGSGPDPAPGPGPQPR